MGAGQAPPGSARTRAELAGAAAAIGSRPFRLGWGPARFRLAGVRGDGVLVEEVFTRTAARFPADEFLTLWRIGRPPRRGGQN